MRSGRAAAFIVEVRRRPVASGVLWLMESHPRPDWRGTQQGYLLSMYTEPAHRRRGHAAAIVQTALAWAREQGVSRVTLHAAPQGRSVYEAAGFRRTHEMRLIFDTANPRAESPTRRRG